MSQSALHWQNHKTLRQIYLWILLDPSLDARILQSKKNNNKLPVIMFYSIRSRDDEFVEEYISFLVETQNRAITEMEFSTLCIFFSNVYIIL